jgi:hypothetical protein
VEVESYKTIKVPLWVYQNAKEVELALSKKGLEYVPQEVLQPRRCPICRSDMEPFETKAKYEYVKCVHCGHTQQLFETKAGGVALGTAIGMGLVYLLNALFGNGRP